MTTTAQNAAAAKNAPAQGTEAKDAAQAANAPSNDVLQDVCDVEEQSAENTTFIARPVGVTKEVQLEAGQNYIFGFDKDDAVSYVQDGNDLKITFNCGGMLILKNYVGVIGGDEAATFAFSDIVPVGVLGNLVQAYKADEPVVEEEAKTGQRKSADESAQKEIDDPGAKVAKVEPAAGDDVAKALNAIETAAGDEGGARNSGYGINSSYATTAVGPLAAVGPIDPTALRYQANFPEPEALLVPRDSGPPPWNPPTIEANFGVDNAQVKEDGSVFVPITASLATNAINGDFLTVTVTGIPATWGLNNVDGTYDAATGTWTIILPANTNYTGGLTFTPPAQSDIDLSGLVASATTTRPSTGQTLTVTDDFGIIVDAVADQPLIDATNSTTGEGDPIAVNIAGSLGVDNDGSELVDHYEISGVPAGFVFNQGTDLGNGVWSFTPAQLAGLTLTPPNSNYSGSLNLTATIFTTENPVSDGEFDTTDNNAQASDAFVLKWKPEIHEPKIEVNGGVEDAQVKEDGSVQVPITASLGANPNVNEFLTVTVTGIDASWGFSAPVGTYNAAAGTWTVVLAPGQNLNTVMTFTPPAQSDIDLTGLTATAVATDPDTGLTANANDGFNIIVDAVADAPSIDATNSTTGEGDPIAVNIAGALGVDNDGSELIHHYEISNVLPGFTFNQGTNLGGGVWSFTPAQLAGLTLTPPNAGFNGQLELTATIFTTENPVSDGEYDTTDNNATATDDFILKWKPEIDGPKIKVNAGVDDAQVKEDGSVNVPITAQLGANPGPNEFLTVTVTGINPAWGFSAPIGTYNAAAGTWTVVLAPGQNLNSVMTFTPPAQSDIDLNGLSATAVATDPDTDLTANANDGFRIIVDAVADAPSITANDNATGEGDPIAVNIAGALGVDNDGSELIHHYEVSGVPAGFTFNQGTNVGGGVWSFTPAQLAGLTLTPPNVGYNGQLNLTATIFTTENPVSDGEYDTTDNNAQASDGFKLKWKPEIDGPSIKVNNGVDDAQVKEDGSVNVPITASLGTNPGANEFLTVTVTGIGATWGFSAPVGTYNAAAGTWTVVLAPGQNLNTVMTFTPPAQSDIDLNGLSATAVATDPDTGLSANANDGFRIIVDAVADAPSINAQDTTTGEGDPIAVNIAGALGVDNDGSERIDHYEVSGVPAGFTFSQGTNLGGGVWSFTPAQLAGLTLTPPNAGYNGQLNLRATIFTTENPVSDGEYDTTDNNAQASDVFCLNWKPEIGGPSIKVNNGVDDAFVKEDSSVVVPITAQLGGNPGPNEYLTVTVTGINPAWGTFSAPVGTYNAATQTWTITLAPGQNLNTAFTFTPNANADIDLNGLVATVVARDPDSGLSASANDNFRVVVDAVADVPNLEAGTASGEEGTTIPLNITTSVNDTDGSEVIEVIKISNLPAGATLTAGVNNGGVWSVTPAQLTGLGINIPNGTSGNFTLNVESVAFERNTSGTERDLFDNRASAFDTLTVCVDKDTTPTIGDDAKTIDETNLGPITVNGTLAFNYNTDGPGSITAAGAGTFVASGSMLTGSLKSHGDAVSVGLAGNVYTGTAAGRTIFTLTVNNNGTYSFTQHDQLDHANGNDANDIISLAFGVRITDSDGDTDPGTITISIKDDGPIANNDSATATSTTPITGNVLTNDDAGEDGLGGVTAVTFNGTTTTVAAGATVTINGTHGILQISSNGNYTYTKNIGAGGTDNFIYTMKDYDGDSAQACLSIVAKPNKIDLDICLNNNVDKVCIKEDTSGFVPVVAHANGGNGNETMSLTVSGIGAGWTLTGTGWTATGVAGQYKITLAAGVTEYNGGFTLAPPHNSDVDLGNISVTATVSDPDGATVTPATDTTYVGADAVVDMPVGSFQMDAEFSWYMWSPQEAPIVIKGGVTDRDGSEVVTKLVFDMNQPFTNPAGGYSTLESLGFYLNKGVETSPGIWEIAINAMDVDATLAGLKLIMPAGNDSWMPLHQWNSAPHAANIVVRSYIEEKNLSGQECDITDNKLVITTNLCFTFALTPLVIDLDNNGINLLDINAGVMFDMNNNGTVDHTTWVGGNDGLLSIDLNNDGVINNQSELFGGTRSLENGFQNLAQYDSNADGVINAADAVFAELKIWQDLNSDGVSQAEELHGLNHFGISSINLNYTNVNYMIADGHIQQESTVSFEDGREATIVDAWFNVVDGADATAYTTIEGTELNDVIYGTNGNDILVGLAGNDNLVGGEGADVFAFRSLDGSVDTITDFNIEQGDVLDVTGLLEGFDAVQDSINEFVFKTEANGNTTVLVDATGSGNIANATAVAVLSGVSGVNLEDLINHQIQQAA